MRDHIEKSLRWLKKLFIDRGYSKRISRELKLEIEASEILLKLSFALHDLGKSNTIFQLNVKRGFMGHEIYSGYLVERILKECYKFDNYIARIIGSAVSLHHHTQIRRQIKGDFKMFPPCESMIKEILSLEGIPCEARWPAFVSREKINYWFDEMRNFFRKSMNLRRVYLFLFPIMICDNLAASSREGYPSILSRFLQSSYSKHGRWKTT